MYAATIKWEIGIIQEEDDDSQERFDENDEETQIYQQG